jgi:hypothetical protein
VKGKFCEGKMQLTLINFFKKNKIPGHLWRGKKRLYKQVTPHAIAVTKQAFELQERNMQLLLRPFLTKEESEGHTKLLGKNEQRMKFWRESEFEMRI